jgi:hypothetical protein
MKKVLRIFALLTVLNAIGAGLVFTYLKMREERYHEAGADAPVVAPSRVENEKEGATVKLDDEAQEQIGLVIEPLAKASVSDEVIASARVLDAADLSLLITELHAAESALEATRADYERKRKLADEGQIASASAVESALAAMKQDQFALDTARAKIVATWGSTIASRSDLTTLATALLSREQAIVRVEPNSTDKLDQAPEVATLERLNGFTTEAKLLGPAPSTDNPLAGKSLLYQVTGNAESLVPGSTLVARLARSGTARDGWLVPRSAIVRNAGRGWIYLKSGDDEFRRHPIELDHPHRDGWLIFDEIEEPVVIHGAQSLLSEELKGSIAVED